MENSRMQADPHVADRHPANLRARKRAPQSGKAVEEELDGCHICRSLAALLNASSRREFMRTRIVQMGAAIGAVGIALMVARTQAFASSKESCSTTTTDATSGPSSDGAQDTCVAETNGPNGATAHAAGKDADATSEASDGSDANATAKGGDADSTSEAGGGSMAVSSAKGEDSDATAESSGGSDTKATAKGSHADATAEAGGG